MSEPVAVTILEREYLVSCTPEERAGLIAAAGLVDGRMRELRNNARSASVDRIAVMAALNIAHEMLQLKHSAAQTDTVLGTELDALKQRLTSALAMLPQR